MMRQISGDDNPANAGSAQRVGSPVRRLEFDELQADDKPYSFMNDVERHYSKKDKKGIDGDRNANPLTAPAS